MELRERKTLDQVDVDIEMSFFDHLESLRWHLVRAVISVVVFTILAFINKSFVFGTLFMGPTRLDFWTYRQLCELSDRFSLGDELCVKTLDFILINTEMAGQFMQHITISFSAGIVLAFPYFAWEMWRFFRPALSAREKKNTRGIVGVSTLLFLMGLAFGYFIITPVTIQFLANYELDPQLKNYIQISDYISMVTMTTLSMGLVFEAPVAVFFLSKGGILTPQIMRAYRRHAIMVILVLSAVITPTSDMMTMTLVALPFYILYELSISVSYFVVKNKLKKERI